MHPKSNAIVHQFGADADYYIRDLEVSITNAQRMFNNISVIFQKHIRFNADVKTHIVIRVDNIVFYAVFSFDESSPHDLINSDFFELNADSKMGYILMCQFNEAWENSSSIEDFKIAQ